MTNSGFDFKKVFQAMNHFAYLALLKGYERRDTANPEKLGQIVPFVRWEKNKKCGLGKN